MPHRKEENNMKLENRVAIVTGGGHGFGRAIAKAMAKEGARVVVAEQAEQRGKEVAKRDQEGSWPGNIHEGRRIQWQ